MTSPQPRSRRFDPDRKANIVEAALNLARESGLKAVTMRSVALRADVPLGSMSYHFTDKAELLHEVVSAARSGTLRKTAEPFRKSVATAGLSRAIAEMVVSLTGENRDQLIFEMDMFLIGMHDENFRSESERWSQDLFDLISPHTDAVEARVIALLVDGLCLNAAVTGARYSVEAVQILVDRTLGE